MTDNATGRIKVIKTPAGEAPLWVREAWVGLTLPCYPTLGVPPESPTGALSGRKIEKDDARDVICTECAGIKSIGVSVPQVLAIEILAKHKPEAAKWWRKYDFPHPGENFFFNKDEVDPVSGVTEAPMRVFDDMETGHWEETPIGSGGR